MGEANWVASYNSWNRGKCKLKSGIKLNCNIQACAYVWYSWSSWPLNRFCCWWLSLTLFEFSSYYSHSWRHSSYTCSSSCWHALFLFFMGYPCRKISLNFIYKHLLLLFFFSQELTSQKEKDFLTVLSLIKNRDPKIYEKDSNFYHDEGMTTDHNPLMNWQEFCWYYCFILHFLLKLRLSSIFIKSKVLRVKLTINFNKYWTHYSSQYHALQSST